ncbi:MAG TPA: OB-fold domain-containing protein, partial [Stellaceae bacterium]|nr:OB-fold domain-containing protein [Stellaceae bacterium]
ALADGLGDRCGFAGAAHGLLMLVHALETAKPGDVIALASFGNGCDAILVEALPGIEAARPAFGVAGSLARGKPTEDYPRFLASTGELNVDWGMRAEFGNKYALTVEYRTGHDNLAFLGGRDKATGVVQFPKTPISVAPGAKGMAEYEDVPLADVPAKVVSFTADWLTYYPNPPFYFGLVQFENGARMLMEFVDVPEGALKVDVPLGMVFRVKEIDSVRGYRHYFWKATPQAPQAEAAQ